MKKSLLAILFLVVMCFPISSNAEDSYKACVGGSLDLSITCEENDVLTFTCDDNCGMTSQYVGYSSIVVGSYVKYSKSYELFFSKSGTHKVLVTKNGSEFDNIVVSVYDEHSYDEGTIKKKATCEKDGIIIYTCGNCEQEKEEKIKSIGHDYTETILSSPTCTRKGRKKQKCNNCADFNYVDIPKIEHNYKTKTINPTCIKNGSKSDVCTYCQDEINYEIIPKTEHNYSDWEVVKKPTIFEAGMKTRLCYGCHGKQAESIERIKTTVTLKKKSVNLKKGKTYVLKIKKKHSKDKVKSFKSSNKKVATVTKKGKITAKKKGTAKITVTMKSGCKATCKIKVK